MQAHTGVTRLELSGHAHQLPPAQLLQRLQRLQDLSIAAPGSALAGVLPAMQQLHQLTALDLHHNVPASPAEVPLRDWMATLPAMLQRLLSFQLKLGYPFEFEAPVLRAVLQQATRLTNLSLAQPHGQLAPQAAEELVAALQRMRCLADLSIELPAVSPQAVGTISQLTALTRLCLIRTALACRH